MKASRFPWMGLTAVLLGSCGGGVATPAASPASTTADEGMGPPAPAPTERATEAAALPSTPGIAEMRAASAPSPVEAVHILAIERALSQPVHSVAVGEAPRVAALGEQPWLFDGRAWRALPLPASLRAREGQREDVDVFFGRDNKPRIMGTRLGAEDGEVGQPVYLRWRNEQWQRERGEIGRLAGNPAAGLFGVLGFEDPEVVCKVGDVCIIKSRSGWTTIAAGDGRPKVVLSEGRVYALHDAGLTTLGASGWRPTGGDVPWRGPTGLWSDSADSLWVSVAREDALYRFTDGAWGRVESPVKGPRGLWGTSGQDIWVAGDGGLAHFDGASWRRVAGLEGSVSEVVGRAHELWIGGTSGLWHGVRASTRDGAQDSKLP